MDKCPICEHRLDQCQCYFVRNARQYQNKRRQVVLDHLYLLSLSQLIHVTELERKWNISYADPELNAIFDKMSAVNKSNSKR